MSAPISADLSRILPRDLANSLKVSHVGLTTADRLPALPPDKAKPPQPLWYPLSPFRVETWPSDVRAAFELLAPQALWVASTDRPVSVALLAPYAANDLRVEGWKGGNPFRWRRSEGGGDREDYLDSKGCWPVALGLSGWQKDRITARLPKDPYVDWGLRKRIWTLGLDDSDDAVRLKGLVGDKLREAEAASPMLDELRNGYINAGWVLEDERRSRDQFYFERHVILPAAKEHGIKVWTERSLEQFLRRAMERAQQKHGVAWQSRFRGVCFDLIEADRIAQERSHALARPAMSGLGEVREPDYRRVPAASPISFPVKRMDPATAAAVEEYYLREKSLGRRV